MFEILVVVVIVAAFVLPQIVRRLGRAAGRAAVNASDQRSEPVRVHVGATSTVRTIDPVQFRTLVGDETAAEVREQLQSVNLDAVPPAMRGMVEAAMKKAFAQMDPETDTEARAVVRNETPSTYGGFPATPAVDPLPPQQAKHARHPLPPLGAKPPNDPLQPYS